MTVLPFSLIEELVSLEKIPLVGVVGDESLEIEINFYKWWLRNKFHANMKWMEKNLEIRHMPLKILPGSKSIVICGFPYFSAKTRTSPPFISRYALCKDYHSVIKAKLNKVLFALQKLDPKIQGKVFTDSAPILEKALARRAGLGWIGKNTCTINKNYGSYFFIGELFLNVEIENNPKIEKNLCASCTRCVDACPTGALIKPGVLDSSRCISYLTIEHRDVIPVEFKNKLSGWMFGCDICQVVCPFNKKLESNAIAEFTPLEKVVNIDIAEALTISGKKFQKKYKDTPLIRTTHKGLLRNIVAIIEKLNSKDLAMAVDSARGKYVLVDMQHNLFYKK